MLFRAPGQKDMEKFVAHAAKKTHPALTYSLANYQQLKQMIDSIPEDVMKNIVVVIDEAHSIITVNEKDTARSKLLKELIKRSHRCFMVTATDACIPKVCEIMDYTPDKVRRIVATEERLRRMRYVGITEYMKQFKGSDDNAIKDEDVMSNRCYGRWQDQNSLSTSVVATLQEITPQHFNPVVSGRVYMWG